MPRSSRPDPVALIEAMLFILDEHDRIAPIAPNQLDEVYDALRARHWEMRERRFHEAWNTLAAKYSGFRSWAQMSLDDAARHPNSPEALAIFARYGRIPSKRELQRERKIQVESKAPCNRDSPCIDLSRTNTDHETSRTDRGK